MSDDDRAHYLLWSPPHRLPNEEFDPAKTAFEVALDVLAGLAPDAHAVDVLRALTKAQCYVIDHDVQVHAWRVE